ncbi:uncharacterized protein [Antedon mediterranea]|uniref:uncharacterized protein isoform X2 n=1 Tax=Antedon mediterranea TaxID=105859 RepID=UPI003AF844E1
MFFFSLAANYRDDVRCGGDWLAPNGEVAICPCMCCSEWGWCGITDGHCLCPNCQDQMHICPTTLPPTTTPPPTLPPPVIYYATFRKIIGRCLTQTNGSDFELQVGSSTRCGKACLMVSLSSGCSAFGFDRAFSENVDCFLYNTTTWTLQDLPTYIRQQQWTVPDAVKECSEWSPRC